ncbi:RNA-binding S4 domain-containing protein [Candidatus Electronema sp. JC]|uniref:RNA-binding S4 domain-containing protein n=1 Tax=Candidatus Electronema sp. JC TaxID=3401570 RepID=UPI003AA97ACC
MNHEQQQESVVRIDKWLWAARFFKTRALASAAVSGGHVQVSGSRVKPSRNVQVGNKLQIRRGEELFEIDVLALSERRGPAKDAALLYAETEDSQAKREAARELRKQIGGPMARPEGRPDKRDRKKIRQFILKE